MRIRLSSSQLEVPLQGTGVVTVSIFNDTDVIAGYKVSLLGADPRWITTSGNEVAVFPSETAEIQLSVNLPNDFPAGHRPMMVQVESMQDLEPGGTVPLDIVVPPRDEVTLRVEPSNTTGGRAVSFGVLVENRGNRPIVSGLQAQDAEAALDISFEPELIQLEPGQTEIVRAETRGGRTWFGNAVPRVITFEASGAELPAQAMATFLQKPRIGRWVLSLAGLLAAISVFAVVIRSSFNEVAKSQSKSVELAQQIATDGDRVKTSTDAGSIGGAVTGPDGEGLEGATVEIVDSTDASAVVKTSTTGTGGIFEVGGLTPGKDYRIRAFGAGFAEGWYAQALDGIEPSVSFDDSDAISVFADLKSSGVNIALGGLPATIGGKIISSDPSGAQAILLRASDQLESQIAEVARVDVNPDGSFVIADIPSPAAYLVRVVKPGFFASPRNVTVDGGEVVEGIEILLVAGTGIITGVVTDEDDQPIGNVSVEATDGTNVVTTVSLTSGDLGRFTLRNLPSPATYSITFTRDGFKPEARTISLGRGNRGTDQNDDALQITLQPAVGVIHGAVRDEGGVPLDGATITVTGPGVSRTTVSSTTGTADEPDQLFVVDSLPVPATYTVTVSLDGYQSETLAVALGEGSAIEVSQRVELVRSTAFLAGSVVGTTTDDCESGPFQAVALAEVVLTDGSTTFTTESATTTDRVSPGESPTAGEGTFILDGIPAGTYTLTASRPGSGLSVGIITLSPGELVTDRQICLEPQARIDGLVTDEFGTPVPDLTVRLYVATTFPSDPIDTTVTAADGAYSFPSLDLGDLQAPETYVIAVFADGSETTIIGSAAIFVAPGVAVTANIQVTGS